jgi:sec-independent protein translocase protein TatB
MFDIGWTEMLVIAAVMIVVVGPKDLPKMLRTFGKTTAKLRVMAGDFQKQFNEALKEAELDDVKKSVDSLRSLNPTNEIKKQLNPFEKAAADVRAGLDAALKPAPKPTPPAASTEAVPAEPLKNGPAAMPNISGPDKMPEPPVIPATAETAAAIAGVNGVSPAAAPNGAHAEPAAKPKKPRARKAPADAAAGGATEKPKRKRAAAKNTEIPS